MRYSRYLLLAVLAGCDQPVTDKPVLEQVARIEYSLVLSIGEDLTNEKTEFGRVSGIAVDSEGRIFVADVQANAVRVFASDGSYRYTIGRAGAGPGEFGRPCCLAVDAQQRLWVRDGGNARYSVFTIGDTAASYVAQYRMQHGDVNRFATTTFESNGNVIDIGTRPDSAGRNVVHRFTMASETTPGRDVVIPELPPESTAMKTITKATDGGSVTLYGYQPFGPQPLVAHGPGGEWAHGSNARYALDWRSVDGSLIRHISGDLSQGPPLSDQEQQRGEEFLAAQSKRMGAQLDFVVPSNKPVLRSLYFGADGRLWVELAVPDGAARLAHVYDGAGRRVAQASWPASVDANTGFVRGDTIWGLSTDSLGVQTIVKLNPIASGPRR